MKNLIAAATLIAATTCHASAADLAARYTKAPAIVTVYDWTGFYLGGHGGYGWGDFGQSQGQDGSVSIPSSSVHTNAAFGGGQMGYKYQFSSRWVVGIQGEFSVFSGHGAVPYTSTALLPNDTSGAVSAQINWLASLTGQAGYAVNNWLFYGRGGPAWMNSRFTNSFNILLPGISTDSSVSASTTRTGWTAGGGVEYGLTRNWTLGIEYDYYDFGSGTSTLFGGNTLHFTGAPLPPRSSATTETFRLKETLSVVKASLNYRF